MSLSLGVVMDPIQGINVAKDSTFAMLLEAQSRGWAIWYAELGDLNLRNGRAYVSAKALSVQDDPSRWFGFQDRGTMALDDLDVVLMRKDPPFDMEYVYATYILEQAEKRGCLVVNRARSLRDANEKMFTAEFPQCCPPTLVSRQATDLRGFLAEHLDIILKPLGGMGGASVFRLRANDPNVGVVIETLTDYGRRYAMAQRFLPEIRHGDKRILVVSGEPVAYALARIPAPGETRGNLAAGGRGKGVPLSERDRWIAGQVGPVLESMGILFAGLDVIGDYLTEINVTSPTCIRELDREFGLNISADLLDAIERKARR